jgi:hypothetical protein
MIFWRPARGGGRSDRRVEAGLLGSEISRGLGGRARPSRVDPRVSRGTSGVPEKPYRCRIEVGGDAASVSNKQPPHDDQQPVRARETRLLADLPRSGERTVWPRHKVIPALVANWILRATGHTAPCLAIRQRRLAGRRPTSLGAPAMECVRVGGCLRSCPSFPASRRAECRVRLG